MAQIDSSIYFQQQQPDFLGSVTKGLEGAARVSDLGRQRQALADDQAVRQTFQNNLVTNPDGTTSLNKKGVVSGLAQVAPQKAMEVQSQFDAQDLAQQKAAHEKRVEVADTVARMAGGVRASGYSQTSYDQTKVQAQKMGEDTSKWPAVVDKDWVDSHFYMGMSAKEQSADALKKIDQQLKADENKNKHQENMIKASQAGNQKQAQAMQQTMTLLSTARGDPAVGQAEKDIYAAQKLNSLINLHGDPNKLNPQGVQLAASEVGKIATGGVPTTHELQGLTPNAIPSKLAAVAQQFTNHPTPANQGAFLDEYKSYADSITKDAQGVIKSKYGRVIESNKRRLHPDDYNSLNDNFVKRFDSAPADKSLHDLSDADLDKAYKDAGGK